MGTFLAVVGFLGFIVFMVMAIISGIKKTGKGKKRMIYAVVCFVLMIIGGAISPDAAEPSSTTAKTDDKVTDSAKQKVDSEAKTKEEEQKKAEAVAKKKAEDEAVAKKKAEEEAAAKKKAEEDSKKIKPGTYKVGTDLPAGEYIVISSGLGYIESAKDSTGQLESIIFNDNLPSGYHAYVSLADGQYFKLQGAEMYPVSSAPSVVPNDGLYKNGMYKVGQDIPAGEYKVILDSALGMGYLEVSSNSSHQLDSIVTNENVQADMYITVKDGQYLTLKDVTIQK